MADISDQGLKERVAECDWLLRDHKDNRRALQWIIGSVADEIKIASYNRANSAFVAGTLIFSENLGDLMAFLTLARGSANFLDKDAYGLALFHNYAWPDNEGTAALRLNPDGHSVFMASADTNSAVGAFQRIASQMMEGELPDDFAERDQLNKLR